MGRPAPSSEVGVFCQKSAKNGDFSGTKLEFLELGFATAGLWRVVGRTTNGWFGTVDTGFGKAGEVAPRSEGSVFCRKMSANWVKDWC